MVPKSIVLVRGIPGETSDSAPRIVEDAWGTFELERAVVGTGTAMESWDIRRVLPLIVKC